MRQTERNRKTNKNKVKRNKTGMEEPPKTESAVK